ncbi:MAG: sugar transferase [Chloroflexota bacterium]|nr:MAG: sugar transferase [Chloroflexota bacterium]
MAVQTAPIQTISLKLSYERAKRVLDIVFTLCIAVPVLLFSAVIALLILADSEGPILYRQKRVGRNGAEFEMLKFRSMYVKNDDSKHREAIKHYMNGSKLNNDTNSPYKIYDDPRVTKVGKFIRSTSLDELPQLLNVLRGEMSLVGPRPPLPYEVELYSLHQKLRLSGKPGLTGPWQIYGRSRVTFENMVEMDIAYLQRQSLWEDIKLIFLTIPVVIRKRGGA